MKNKQGFTLVELLAVIAILAILATVATPLVMTASKKSKEKMYIAKVKMIESAAVLCAQKYGLDNDKCKSVSELCLAGYLTKDNKASVCQSNPVNGKEMNCDINITNPNGRYTASMDQTNDGCKNS